jgi:SAM-dependent methyltransferase
MHKGSLLKMEWFVNKYLPPESEVLPPVISVLDVGSYDVNGSYKQFFADTRFSYTGLDMAEGPNVDIAVENPYYWSSVEDESFDVIISGQAFEHIEFFWLTLSEMIRALKKEGLMCIIAPREMGRHRYPIDCYRFDVDGMIALAKYGNLKPLHASTNLAPPGVPAEWYSGDSMLVAKKPENWSGIINAKEYKYTANNYMDLETGFIEFDMQEKYLKFPKENIVLFGCGEYGLIAKRKLEINDFNIVCFVDNDKTKQGHNVDGISVLSPEESLSITDSVYIISIYDVDVSSNIHEQLRAMGIEKSKIFYY